MWRKVGCCACLAVAASLGLEDPARAEGRDRWRVLPSVGLQASVTVQIHWFDSTRELREAARNSGEKIREHDLDGFAILKRNAETGEYVCEVYVVKMMGAFTSDMRTTVFGHEILHCFGLRHD